MIETATQGRKALIEIQTKTTWSYRQMADKIGISAMCISLTIRKKHKKMATTTMMKIDKTLNYVRAMQ